MSRNLTTGLWIKHPGMDDRLVALRESKQLSTRDIAGILSSEFHCNVSRNSIIGKIKRMALPSYRPAPKPSAKPARSPRPRGRPARRAPLPAPLPPEPEPFRCDALPTLLELKQTDCRFPYGTHPRVVFCGRPQVKGHSFCIAHMAVVWVKPEDYRRRRHV